MGEKNFCSALFFPLQPEIIILILFKRTKSAFWGLLRVNEASPSLCRGLQTRGKLSSHSWLQRTLLQSLWSNSLVLQHSCLRTQCPLQTSTCSFAAPFQVQDAGKLTSGKSQCGNLKHHRAKLLAQSLPGKAGNKLPGQILSKHLLNPEENPICLTAPTNVAQMWAPTQEPPVTTWERKLHHKKSPKFISPNTSL